VNGSELRSRLNEAASSIDVAPFGLNAVEDRARVHRRKVRAFAGVASTVSAVAALVAASFVIPSLASRSPHVSPATGGDASSAASAARTPIAPEALGSVLSTVATDALQPLVGRLPEPKVKIADQSRRRLSAGDFGHAGLAQVSFVDADSAYTLSMDYSPAETEGLETYCENMLRIGFSVSCEATTYDDKVVIVETRQVFVTMKDGSIGESEAVAPGNEPLFGGEPWTRRMVSVVDRATRQRTSAAEWVPRVDGNSSSLSHTFNVSIEALTALAESSQLVMKDPAD
jgi:hypothetical protein